MNKVITFQTDLVKYMKTGDTSSVGTLRLIVNALKNYAIEQKKLYEDLTDSEVDQVLDKQAKQRKDSIESFKTANRQDLVDKEQAELTVILSYLPKKLSKTETTEAVKKIITEKNITQISQMGQIMGELSKLYGSTVDMGLASSIAKSLLAS